MLLLPAMVLLGILGAGHALPPPEKPLHFLMLLPFSTKSHRNVFMPLATALCKRGHKITMLSNHPPHDTNENITYLMHDLEHFRAERGNMFEEDTQGPGMFDRFKEIFPLIGRDFYKDETVKKLYAKKQTFDAFIIDQLFNEVTFPFAHNRPMILLTPSCLDPSNSAMMGNVQNPSYVMNFLTAYDVPMSFTDRVKNLFMSISLPVMWKGATRELVQVEISKQFPNLPTLAHMERQQSLNLINCHFSFGSVLPMLPNQVEVGGMHLRPSKPLPKDLESFLSGSTPVIYFSLGSVLKSKDLGLARTQIFINAFSKLPYKVLWKYEADIKNLPSNIKVEKWMPQQDILGHQNVKVFISHCGLLGTQEALYNGVPMFGMPVFAEQPKNARIMKQKGFGRFIDWKQLSEELLVNELTELITNPKYAKVARGISRSFKDQLNDPTERAVYWTEYVTRHDGAPQLRSAQSQLSWIEFLNLDIIFVSHVILTIVYKLLKKLLGLCFGSKKVKQE